MSIVPRAMHLVAVLVFFCCADFAQTAAQRADFDVIDPPYDTPVQNLLAPALAMGFGPTGGAAFLSGAVGASKVCVAVDAQAVVAPVTVTTVDGLFYNVSGAVAHLDVTHECYLDTTQGTPRCVATLTSTAADCGGVAASAVGPLLNASMAEVATSSAAVLASYLRSGVAQRRKLERSLRRTREVVHVLSHTRDLVLSASSVVTDEREMTLLLGGATQYVRTVVGVAYDRVMEKYYVLDAWTNQSLGKTVDYWSAVAGPMVRDCDVQGFTQRLLWGTEPSSTVLLALMQATLAVGDGMRGMAHNSALRGVQCAQVLTSLTVMALEDDAVRQVASMIALNTLNASSVWALGTFELLAADRTTTLRQRQLWSLAYVFGALADPAIVETLVSSAAVAECMRRAALVVPNAATGSVPPSIYWCLDNASMSEMPQTAVAQRSLAVRESDTAANGQCLWGFSDWDGGCDRAVFDPARCESCPPGSVGDGEGHCVCGNGTHTYVTLTSGCLVKGAAHDIPGVRLLQENGNVSLSGNTSVTLFSVQLPQTASLADPSAYLRVNVTCVDGDRGGGTRLLATPSSNRSAVCASVVAYERHAERTGERDTFNGTQYFTTYAENLTIVVLGSAAFFGETCRVEVGVQSALRQASRSLVAGTWTFIPRAEAFTLAARSYSGNAPTNAAAAPSDVPLCSQGSATAASDKSAVPATVHTGVCRTTDGGPALFVLPSSYAAFGTSTQHTMSQRIRSSGGAARDASFVDTLQSLASVTGFELTVVGTTSSDVLWSGTWQVKETPLAVNAWAAGWVVPLNSSVLRSMRSVRLRVVDTTSASAFAASEAAAELRYGSDSESSSGGSSGDSSDSGKGKDPSTDAAGVHYDFWYVILIAIVSVLDGFVLVAFGMLLFLRFSSYDSWPNWCK